MKKFSHYDDNKSSIMVDVTDKDKSIRTAIASGCVYMAKETIALVKDDLLPKGNPFEIARIAGIMAAKKTSDLIPMCHPLMLTYINVKIELDEAKNRVDIIAEARLEGKTGIEMEVLAAVSGAALTIYDMCKAVDKNMLIGDIKLLEKRGGKSDYLLKQEK